MKHPLTTAMLCAALLPAVHAHTAPDHPAAAAQTHDRHAIEHVMKRQFDKPQSPLKVAPIAIEGAYAVAGWLQDDRGGRALLRKQKDGWRIVVCAGDGLKRADMLVQAGMGADAAQKLALQLKGLESRLPAQTLKKFASFEGVVHVDAASAHGHAADKHAPAGTGHAKH
jgi:periplasmic copper chaperone A